MSVATEITRLQNAKTALKASINAKTDEQHQITTETIDDYADFVDSITTGGGGGEVPIFSPTEVVVGTWIDNKPLYMKTCSQDITVSSSGFNTNIAHGISGAGIMFLGNNSFIGIKSNMTRSFPINYTNTTSNTYSKFIRTNISTNGNINTYNNGGIFDDGTEVTVVCNVFYTKASDSEVADVSEIKGNHYAQTEHEVGKTSDGEIVYEKTVLKNANYGYNNPFNQSFAHNISNAKQIWISDGSFLFSEAQSLSNRIYMPLNYINANSDKARQYIRADVDGTNISIYMGDYIRGNGMIDTFTTLRYIKNT